MPRNRARLFWSICAICALGLTLVYLRLASEPIIPAPPPSPAPKQISAPVAPAIEAKPIPASVVERVPQRSPALRRIFFRWTNVDQHYGQLAYVDRSVDSAPFFVEGLSCEVVHYAAGHGICLTAKRGVFTRYTAQIFDRNFDLQFTVPLNGIPSRTRVSPDGKVAAVTVFLTGHSYASVDFTTQTLLIDTATGTVLADLEQFSITRDGQPFRRDDFNFWGVTFAGVSGRFYCTLSTGRKHFLVEGDATSRKGRVIRENVECPSISPNLTKIAFKKRMPGDRVVWQLHVLDLSGREETPLLERRNIDDQLEWLDDRHVLYALPKDQNVSSPSTNVWVAAIDGTEEPRLYLSTAYSPAVVRN